MAEPQEAIDEVDDLRDLLAQIDDSIDRLERRQLP
jgi:myxalamid-type polyketide synthase MxaE and MxaD